MNQKVTATILTIAVLVGSLGATIGMLGSQPVSADPKPYCYENGDPSDPTNTNTFCFNSKGDCKQAEHDEQMIVRKCFPQ